MANCFLKPLEKLFASLKLGGHHQTPSANSSTSSSVNEVTTSPPPPPLHHSAAQRFHVEPEPDINQRRRSSASIRRTQSSVSMRRNYSSTSMRRNHSSSSMASRILEMPLFGKSQKNPVELVKALRDAVQALERGDKKAEKEQLPTTLAKALKAQEDVSKNLSLMKNLLYGTGEEAQGEMVLSQLGQEMYSSHLLLLLIQNLSKIDFEGRKDVAQIFNNVLRRQIGQRFPTVEYIYVKPQIIFLLMSGYEKPDIALNCGTMLRECVRHESLAKIILYSDDFYNFFKYVEVSSFDIASDAFSTFKELLTRHKALAAEFLETNYDRVFTHYQALLNSDNYVTRRQSLKLLGELLLDRHNFNVMTRYISNAENLKLMMNMLKEKSRNIQFEAFHVFKVFVANPNKPKPILDILLRNREKLIDFLSKFHTDRQDDEQFNDEKAYLIKQIRELKPMSNPSGTSMIPPQVPPANPVNNVNSDQND